MTLVLELPETIEARFDFLLESNPAAAFKYLADATPQNRAAAGLSPLPSDAVKSSYEARDDKTIQMETK